MNKLIIFVILTLITFTAFYFKKDDKRLIIQNQETPKIKKSQHQHQLTTVDINKDKVITKQLTEEFHQIFNEELNQHNIKKASFFIVKMCIPINQDQCKDICVNKNKEPIACEFELIEQDKYFSCAVNDSDCEERIELKLEEQIVSQRSKILKNNMCLTNSSNCIKETPQIEVSDFELETFLTPTSIRKYQQNLAMTKILDTFSKDRQQLSYFSYCLAQSMPQSVKNISDVSEIAEDDERIFELFQECADNLKLK